MVFDPPIPECISLLSSRSNTSQLNELAILDLVCAPQTVPEAALDTQTKLSMLHQTILPFFHGPLRMLRCPLFLGSCSGVSMSSPTLHALDAESIIKPDKNTT